MPRAARPNEPAVIHHLISRFVNREFRLTDHHSRDAYRERLRRAWKRVDGVRIAAFGLMSTHTHLAAGRANGKLGPFLHSANTAFGRWYNIQTTGLGSVFAERPWSKLVDTAGSLARLNAYIHNNPGRAGLVKCPSETDWTTHRAFLGLVSAPVFVDVAWALAEMGFSSSNSGRLSFHDFVVSRSLLPRDPSLSGPGPSSVEAAQRLLLASATCWNVDPKNLARPGRSSELAESRLTLVAVARDVFGLRVDHLAAGLGLSPAVVGRLRRRATATPEEHGQVVESYLQVGASDLIITGS